MESYFYRPKGKDVLHIHVYVGNKAITNNYTLYFCFFEKEKHFGEICLLKNIYGRKIFNSTKNSQEREKVLNSYNLDI